MTKQCESESVCGLIWSDVSHISATVGPRLIHLAFMILSIRRPSTAKYANYLAEQKEEQEVEKWKKRKENDAIHELEGKRKRLKTDVSSLLSTSKELYEKCEKSGELSLVTKANALRRRAEEKQQEVEVLDREIAERLLATKQ